MENTDQTAAEPAHEAPESEVASEVATDPKTALAEYLEQCRKAVAECFVCGSNPALMFSQQLESLNTAERLMRVSMKLINALDPAAKSFTHRIVVEHRTAPDGYEVERRSARDPYDVTPPPRIRKSKTIPGVAEPRVRNIG
jgi:hypothetical protein